MKSTHFLQQKNKKIATAKNRGPMIFQDFNAGGGD